ncbi:hypothetical protein [Bacillus sp. B-jedd]|uniref:hypothetical protein n=1 Tax=Bacillus sp. B-jedd TaxID=1476857 RepID=UPI0005156DD6|nr:hypothetical protein [Bacillus sp. B-jedd]CEG27170.1 hypothetical protein BN1002_02026 [Bacillus sp. B-jedd]
MLNIFVGLIFVFFKTNFSFWDIGPTFYITNIIGYVLIFFGLNELERTNQPILKAKPYVIIMIAHSMIFFLLNITDHSPLTMGMSTTLEQIIVLAGVALIMAGMFMVFIIIFQLMDGLTSNMNKEVLYNLVTIMILLFILAGIDAFFNFVPTLSTIIMGALLLLEVLFLFCYYNAFVIKNEKLI